MNDLLAFNEKAKRNGQKQRCEAPVKRMLLWMFSLRISLPLSKTVMKSKQPSQCRSKVGRIKNSVILNYCFHLGALGLWGNIFLWNTCTYYLLCAALKLALWTATLKMSWRCVSQMQAGVGYRTHRFLVQTHNFNQLARLSNLPHTCTNTHTHTLSVEWTQAAAEECYLKSPLLLFL